MAKRGNPYRCRYCGRLSSATLVCKFCQPKQELAMKVKKKLEEGPKPEVVCRIQNCNEPVHVVWSGPTELCKKHFYGDEQPPLIRKSFVTDINADNRFGGTPGAIPIKGGSGIQQPKIEGWK